MRKRGIDPTNNKLDLARNSKLQKLSTSCPTVKLLTEVNLELIWSVLYQAENSAAATGP